MDFLLVVVDINIQVGQLVEDPVGEAMVTMVVLALNVMVLQTLAAEAAED
jgi:hypothetical protein